MKGTNVYDGTANPVAKIRGKKSYVFNVADRENPNLENQSLNYMIIIRLQIR